jgi:ribonuclease HII
MLSPYYLNPYLEAGTDEAGRGCLAGPVTAAAIILPQVPTFEENTIINSIENLYALINDSKQLSEKAREKLSPIIEKIAISFAITNIEPVIIDEINILNASLKAMQECVLKLNPKPEYIIVDGNRPLIQKKGIVYKSGKIFSEEEKSILQSIPTTSIVKGDEKFLSIAAASILAKTYRDAYMNEIHEEFPMYNWKKNKGYPTKEHREAIRKYGITKYHRLSFRLLPEQYALEL